MKVFVTVVKFDVSAVFEILEFIRVGVFDSGENREKEIPKFIYYKTEKRYNC